MPKFLGILPISFERQSDTPGQGWAVHPNAPEYDSKCPLDESEVVKGALMLGALP